MTKRTNIVCTIGPSCESVDMLTKMSEAGMNVARLNFSHGTHENHKQIMDNVRTVKEQTGRSIAILQDIQGPKIRLGNLPEEGVVLEKDQEVIFDTSLDDYDGSAIPVDYKELHTYLKPDERILLNDGKSEVKIVNVEGTQIHGTVTVAGTMTSHKGMNVPDSTLTMRVLTDKDKDDVRFGVEHDVDYIALSFVMRPEDVTDLKELIRQYEQELGKKSEFPIRVIAKIERREAVDQIDAILDVVDGIMVARGDLGIEIPAAEVPVRQKMLIQKAIGAGKPVIVATQMLDSMAENPRPTRAEVSDVANAVIDHADATMLSNETSTGKFPLEAVQTMADIITETEKSHYDDLPMHAFDGQKHAVDVVLSGVSRIVGEETGASFILAASYSGNTGRLISRNRPQVPIAVAVTSERVRAQLALSWGVYSFIIPECNSVNELIDESVKKMKETKHVATGDRLIVVAGNPVGHAGHVNMLEIHEVA